MLREEAKNLHQEPCRFSPAHRRDAMLERARQDEWFALAKIAEEFQLNSLEAVSLPPPRLAALVGAPAIARQTAEPAVCQLSGPLRTSVFQNRCRRISRSAASRSSTRGRSRAARQDCGTKATPARPSNLRTCQSIAIDDRRNIPPRAGRQAADFRRFSANGSSRRPAR